MTPGMSGQGHQEREYGWRREDQKLTPGALPSQEGEDKRKGKKKRRRLRKLREEEKSRRIWSGLLEASEEYASNKRK